MGKKTAKVKNKASVWNFASVVLVAVFCLTLINQGGFYEGAIIFAGLILSAFLLVKTVNFKISLSGGLLLLFAMWYFFCSVKNGFITEYAAKGLMPFVLFLFLIFKQECNRQTEHIFTAILKFSLCLAAISVVQFVVLSLKNDTFMRLLFPFNYANVTGIYFSVCFFLSVESKDLFVRRASFLFATASLLTLSVGAVLLSFLYAFFLLLQKRKFRETILLSALVIVAAFVAKSRIIQSGGTFLERLLQIYDGFLCMIKNPVFGIGAGSWENAKQFYQTGFYSAKVIHCSFVQLGVDSGFLGLFLFFAASISFLKDTYRNKKKFALCLLVLMHSFIDFSLSFTAIGFLLILLSENPEAKTFSVKEGAKYIVAIIAFCIFLVSAYGLSSAKSFEQGYRTENIGFFARHSVNAAKSYALKGNFIPDDMFFIGKKREKPYELVLNEAAHREDRDKYLISVLKERPYDVNLMRFIEENCTEEYINKARSYHEQTVASLSPLGEILYNLKGVNQ